MLIDNAATFGSNVGTPSYTGPQLQDFVSGDKIDLKNISSAGVTFSYNSSTGLLQVSNGASQVATLDFQNSSLGSGSFDATSDGGTGTFITLGPVISSGTGGADVEWQDGIGGPLAAWAMNGAQIASGQEITFQGNVVAPNASWSVAGIGDFNGDDNSDLLWRNQNGTLVDWSLNGSQITSAQDVTFQGSPAAPNSSWNVAGIGDFNGDGKSDILWRNTNGTVAEWTMNGSQVTSGRDVTFQGNVLAPNATWSVAGIGDFDGDGKSDVLWRNTDGTLAEWTMNGSQSPPART